MSLIMVAMKHPERLLQDLVMKGIRKKLKRCIDLHLMACGHEESVAKACSVEFDLMQMVRNRLTEAYNRGNEKGKK